MVLLSGLSLFCAAWGPGPCEVPGSPPHLQGVWPGACLWVTLDTVKLAVLATTSGDLRLLLHVKHILSVVFNRLGQTNCQSDSREAEAETASHTRDRRFLSAQLQHRSLGNWFALEKCLIWHKRKSLTFRKKWGGREGVTVELGMNSCHSWQEKLST